MTNDGELAQKLLHPKFEINKTYQVTIRGAIDPQKIRSLEQGIDLDGRQTWPAKITVQEKSGTSTTLHIIIHEGRKRQVRRMFEAVGHPVLHLKRLAYGKLRLGNLGLGKYRVLSPKDMALLFS